MSVDYRYPHSRVSLPVLTPGAASSNDAARNTAADARTEADSNAPAAAMTAPANPPPFLEEKLLHGKVIEALSQIYDPEIPVNIYELGLVYDIKINPDHSVKIVMTLTAPACPVAGSLPGEVERKVEAIPEVKSAEVELVWEPPWSRELMSEAALLTLGML